MTKEQMLIKIKEEKLKFEKKCNQIYKEYAFSNNKVIIGDIIKDHCQKIEVVEIKFAKLPYLGVPDCVYYGYCLTANNKRFKNNKTSVIYQSNLKEIIKEMKRS